jgi:hypothetical protein
MQIESTISDFNRKASALLRSSDFSSAISCLESAYSLLAQLPGDSRRRLLSLTLNNLGCAYKRAGQLETAVAVLEEALDCAGAAPADVGSLAGTHLNLCGLFSQQNEHRAALEHALQAVRLVRKRFRDDVSMLTTLLAGYHNAGVEFTMLGQVEEARRMYQIAWEIACEQIGEKHPLTVGLRERLKKNKISIRLELAEQKGGRIETKYCTPASAYEDRSGGRKKRPAESVKGSERTRFVTGERLQPMFRREERAKRISYDATRMEKAKIKVVEAQRDFSRSEEDKKAPTRDETGESKMSEEKHTERTDGGSKERKVGEEKIRKVSIATQAECFDRSMLQRIRNRAAVKIQKWFRGYMARTSIRKAIYLKQIKEAKVQKRRAKAKLQGLERGLTKTTSLTISTPEAADYSPTAELIPIAFKNKLGNEFIADRTRSMSLKYQSSLQSIPEEHLKYGRNLVHIQRHVRGWTVRKDFVIRKRAIITLQKNIRMFLARNSYLKLYSSVLRIQRFWKEILRIKRRNLRDLIFS